MRRQSPAVSRMGIVAFVVAAGVLLSGSARAGDDGYGDFVKRIEGRIPGESGAMRRALRLSETTGLLRQIFELTRPAPAAPVSRDAAPYFPFSDGARYTYVDTVTDQDFEMRVERAPLARGGPAWKVVRPMKFLPKPDHVTMSVSGDGVLMHQRQLSGALLTFEPAVKLCEAKVVPGATYETTPAEVNPGTGCRLKWIATVEGIERVKVPAGEYEALKIRLIIRDAKAGTKFSDLDLYYGKGAGLVKRRGFIFGGFGGEELKAYSAK